MKHKTHCIRGHVLSPANRIGGKGQCKLCIKHNAVIWKQKNPDYRKKWRKKHKDRLRLEHIGTRYGMSELDYADLLVIQDNKCAVCKVCFNLELQAQTPHVDHCHISGKIRGLLCRGCNSGLGQFSDSVVKLKAAIEYLLRKG